MSPRAGLTAKDIGTPTDFRQVNDVRLSPTANPLHEGSPVGGIQEDEGAPAASSTPVYMREAQLGDPYQERLRFVVVAGANTHAHCDVMPISKHD